MIDNGCPFYGRGKGLDFCKASVPDRVPEAFEQKTLCLSENYDLCPTFLGHTLRIENLTRRFAGWI
ncbi:MAG TPA: hypothetical protein VFF54_05870 [Thermodesulfobacteriota bacterium]|nr:hypothetical protein [Thermodesulfobacteriota bacterium]